MERLTTVDPHTKKTTLIEMRAFYCDHQCKFSKGDCSQCPIQSALNRLSEYEDLNRTPDELKKILNEVNL